LPSREARAEADWLAIDHREALRAAPAELRPMREDVARRRAAYEARQARLVELGAEMRAEAEAADRRIAEAGAAAAAALLDGLDDRSEPPPADPNGAEVAAALAVAEVAERTLPSNSARPRATSPGGNAPLPRRPKTWLCGMRPSSPANTSTGCAGSGSGAPGCWGSKT
jgi:hypothetical protein